MEISAKLIEWEVQAGQDLSDSRYGFYISFNAGDNTEFPYCAAWGEGEDDNFKTLEEAKEWCQKTIDDWMRENVVMTPNPKTPESET